MKPKYKMEGTSHETRIPATPRKYKSSEKSKFKFEPPPEAPVFLPTLQEFENPLKYINKIRPIGQKTGICKIIPPAGWKVPFVLDMDKLKFTPRIQRINELGARTRIKLNFLDQLTKFYALKGKTFQIPIIEKRTLDLYTLHKLVCEFGGIEIVTKCKKWQEIAQRMNFLSPKTPPLLRNHYDHLILPFITARLEAERKNEKGENESENSSGESVPAFRELKSLTFLGPGPKMAVCDIGGLTKSVKTRTRGKKIMYEFDPLAKYMCKSCSHGDIDEPLVTCATCDDRYHSSCLIPPLTEANIVGWRCPKCVATEHSKSLEDFGFAQAEREYTLNEFREMADNFKSNYFKTSNPREIPTSTVESEFWRIISSIEESVTVEYGADLHVIDHGSGFPIKNKTPEVTNIDPETFNKYADSAWNLNNLPVLKASVLRHISADISGMKIPWMYAGMCFATFCWHNEDHWSYSINYLHMGEPKTWYGVPGSSAEDFEKAMREEAPELFDSQPDILHQLVTIMDPNDIMKTGVPMYRTDQKEGEFVITFPRAYHAGFNQGFNFAEACNFAPYDWLQIGRECISHYSSLKRFCVFSHDELVCKMAEIYDELDKKILLATYKDMKTMVNTEHTKRRFLLMQGIRNASRIRFDELPDDERQCFVCKTTCFLSALVCKCSPSKLVCLEHYEQLCKCPPSNFKLKFHYKIDELVAILYVMRNKVEHFDKWVISVNKSSSDPNRKIYFRIFTELLIDSKDKEFTKDELLKILEEQVKNCLKISTTAKSYIKNIVDSPKIDKKVSLDDLIEFSKQLKNFPCALTETSSIKNLVECGLKLKKTARKIMNSRIAKKQRLQQLINIMKSVNIEFDELAQLEAKLIETEWIEKCTEAVSKNPCFNDKINSLIEEGDKLPCTKAVLRQRHELYEIACSAQMWGNKFKTVYTAPYLSIEEVEKIADEAKTSFYVKASEKEQLLSTVQEAREVNKRIEEVLSGVKVLYISELQDLVAVATSLPVNFPSLSLLKDHISAANRWYASAQKLFIKRATIPLDLMSVLWPRRFTQRSYFYIRPTTMSYRAIEGIIKENDHNFTKADFHRAFKEQVSSLFQLRLTNTNSKLDTNKKCPCGGFLNKSKTVECELCCTVFHSKCFVLDEQSAVPMLYNTYSKLLCSFCVRSKRPHFEKITQLISEARKLTVKIPECLALEWNFRKIRSWLKTANKVLSYRDFSSSLEIISNNCKNISKMSFSKKDSAQPILPSLAQDVPDFQHVQLCGDRLFDLKFLLYEIDSIEVTTREGTNIWMLIMASNLWRFNLSQEFIPEDIAATSEMIRTKMQVIKKVNSKLRKKPNIRRVIKKIKNVPDVSGALRSTCSTKGSSPIPSYYQKPSSPGGSSVTSEHGEECAAEQCQKPIEDSLDWVQCDGKCGQWFHMKCVDLTKQEVSDDDEYICENCLKFREDVGEADVVPVEPLSLESSLDVDPLSLPPAGNSQLHLY